MYTDAKPIVWKICALNGQSCKIVVKELYSKIAPLCDNITETVLLSETKGGNEPTVSLSKNFKFGYAKPLH